MWSTLGVQSMPKTGPRIGTEDDKLPPLAHSARTTAPASVATARAAADSTFVAVKTVAAVAAVTTRSSTGTHFFAGCMNTFPVWERFNTLPVILERTYRPQLLTSCVRSWPLADT